MTGRASVPSDSLKATNPQDDRTQLTQNTPTSSGANEPTPEQPSPDLAGPDLAGPDLASSGQTRPDQSGSDGIEPSGTVEPRPGWSEQRTPDVAAQEGSLLEKRGIVGPEGFINRELSWLAFNARVLEEAEDPQNPLLERVKFLAITSSNLDEFLMVRVAGLREQTFGDEAPQDLPPDGQTADEQLRQVAAKMQAQVAAIYRCWNDELAPSLAAAGIRMVPHRLLSAPARRRLDEFFDVQVLPVVTPMAIDPSHPSPLFHNRGLYLATILKREARLGPKRLFAVVQIPSVLPRFVSVTDDAVAGDDHTPGDTLQSGSGRQLDSANPEVREFVLLEEVIADRLPVLFGPCQIEAWTTFRITRDSDLDLLDEEGDDMLRLIEERLKARHRGDAVRMEVHKDAPAEITEALVASENLHDDATYREVYRVDGPVGLTCLWQLVRLPGYAHLREPPLIPQPPRGLAGCAGQELFAAIGQQDILLHHPYDCFDPVVELTQVAAADPQVLAIKQTLYRTGGDSPVVKALIEAAGQGKHVTALVELKARFDEQTNVGWAREMERAGVHVVFGFLDLKTHCKLTMVVRQEGQATRRYVHLSTGNYNPSTARLYTDVGLFTANEGIAADVTAVFNLLTGYSQGHRWQHLIVAPQDLHTQTIELIRQQARLARMGQPNWIFAKVNALVDPQVIGALYEASQAGVKIDLVVRGICCLRPGVPGLSETIEVRSIVDRFLEHSRLFLFGLGEDASIYLSSADWMPRNFHRRVEVMFPVLCPEIRHRLQHEIVPLYLRDNLKARLLQPDGTYSHALPAQHEPAHRCQIELMQITRAAHRARTRR